MDRQIVYPGAIPQETDILNSNKYAMIGLSKLAAAIFGTSTTVANGLSVVPTSPASLQVYVTPGELYSMVNVDGSAYSSLAADTTHQILKQGILMDQATLSCPAPGTAGQSINYLIEAAYADADSGATVLPYYNSSNPSVAYSGPANSGTAQNTVRKGAITLVAKAGTAATTGSQTTPAADTGFVGLWAVTVANGQSTITSGNIVKYTNAPILPAGGLISAMQSNALKYADDTGAVNAYVVNRTTPATAYTDGMLVGFSTLNANTSATVTINVDGLGVISATQQGGAALQIGQIPDNTPIWFTYNSTGPRLELLGGLSQATVYSNSTLFDKASSSIPCLTKTGASTLSVLAGTRFVVAGVPINFTTTTAVVMPTLTAGTDYAIYVCTDGTIRADSNFTAPTGYTTANSRLIGGFHYGLVAPATTVAGGSFATTGNGMIWVQSNVDDIAGINKYSIWDLKFRPVGADPRGMVLVGGRTWVDIYLCSTDADTNSTSKYNTNIASGTVLPKIPAAFGGNGTTTYPTLNWWAANELARSQKKRLMWEHEFVEAAFGVTENQSIDATASTYPTTLRNAGYTSKYGIEQVSGHHWIWGLDSSYDPQGTATPANYDVNGNNGAGTGRGQVYIFTSLGLIRALFGGARTGGSYSGSRASSWFFYPWYSSWSIGLRAACDHMQLV